MGNVEMSKLRVNLCFAHLFSFKHFDSDMLHCFYFLDRGPCMATISLWLVFVYVEASVRLREIKSVPFHLDLCRPFAAHW